MDTTTRSGTPDHRRVGGAPPDDGRTTPTALASRRHVDPDRSIDGPALLEANARLRERARATVESSQQLKVELERMRTEAELARIEAQLGVRQTDFG